MNKKIYIVYSLIIISILFFIYKYNTYFNLNNYVSGDILSELDLDVLKKNTAKDNDIILLSNDISVEVKSIELNSSYTTNKIEILDHNNNNYHLNSADESINYCVISSDLSNALFGQSDSVGQKIEYEEKIYIVRDIIKSESNMFIISANKYSKLTQIILITDSVYNNKKLRKYASDNNIDIEIHNNMLLIILVNILLLICILMLVIKLVQAIKVRLPFHIIALSILLGLLIICFIKYSYFPREYLPTKWSDFQFFYRLKEDILSEYRYLFMSKKPLITYELYENIYLQINVLVILIIEISYIGNFAIKEPPSQSYKCK